jgi:16S rRNA (cytidine1402-2'-O)-methyltransferase
MTQSKIGRHGVTQQPPDAPSAAQPPANPSEPLAERKLAPGLHVAATPIGNLRDVTLRLLDALAAADLVACEDTRVTERLLARHGVKARLFAYHDHNAEQVRPRLLAALAEGQSVLLVSDAGTPLISDPGYKLVRAAIAAGHPVLALPGPSAVTAALAVAGLPTDRFLFAGFLPAKAAARRSAIAELAAVRATLVLLESPQRLAEALADMAAGLGPRPAAVARELTKRFEEVRRDRLDALAAHYAAAGPPKGEITLVIAPPDAAAAREAIDLDAALRAALARFRLSEAVAAVAAETGLPRRQVYARALELSAATP